MLDFNAFAILIRKLSSLLHYIGLMVLRLERKLELSDLRLMLVELFVQLRNLVL